MTLGLGGQFAPEYRWYLPDSLVVEARFRLRTASYVFWAVTDHASALLVPGLMSAHVAAPVLLAVHTPA